MLSLALLTLPVVLGAIVPRDVVDPGPPSYVSYPMAGMSVPGSPPSFYSPENVGGKYQHVVFLSIDGFHGTDLQYYASTFPQSTLASLLGHAIEYTNARCSVPSDSGPATTAYSTGASPRTHGIYYDDAYAHDLYPPDSNCTGPIGTVTTWEESIDIDDTVLNGGGGFNVSLLPLKLTEGGYCAPVYPWDFVRVNTVFE